MISSSQIRAARGLIGASQTDIAARAGVSVSIVKRAEGNAKTKISDDARGKIVTALESAGVIFIPGNGDGPGVRLKKSPS